jgi:LPS-assembly lipoprotein
MSWSRSALAAAGVVLLVGGCGFHPLYGQRAGARSAVPEQMAAIKIGTIEDRQGQLLRNALVDRLTPRGEPSAPAYDLRVTLTQQMVGLGQQKNSYASLGEMSLSASFHLGSRSDDAGFSGSAHTVVSVNYLGPRYASVAVEREASERAIGDIADSIRDQVAAWLGDPANKPAPRQLSPDLPPHLQPK